MLAEMFDTNHHFQQLDSFVGSNSCGVYFNTAPGDTNGLSFEVTHLVAPKPGWRTPTPP